MDVVVPSGGMSEGWNKVLVLIRHEMLRRYAHVTVQKN